MRMLLGLSEALPNLVEAKFKAANASQSLIFTASELAIIRTSTGIPFQLRYCPSLAKKPVPKQSKLPQKKKPDVFENPPADLLIANVPTTSPGHFLVLNKYPIIAEHFIIVTKEYKPQAHLLERDDLEATYTCLKAWQDGHAGSNQKRLFAFFNSGEHSGASQPRRHLQFLPVESMRNDQNSNGWDLLMDLVLASSKPTAQDAPSGLLQHPDIAFSHFALPLPAEPTGHQLEAAYHELYQSARHAVEEFVASNPATSVLHSTANGSLPISYNLALTTEGMAILPRRNEGGMLRRDDGTDVGFIALNGTTLGGTLMVKHQEEWDVLRKQPGKLDLILEAIGIPKAR